MATKKYNLSIVVLAVLALSVVQLPSVYATDSPADTKQVLIFLRDVIGIDTEKYEVALSNYAVRDYTTDSGPIGNLGYVETLGRYTLGYWDATTEYYSFLEATFNFADTTLVDCNLNVIAGSIEYSNPLSKAPAEAYSEFLERHQSFTKDSKLSSMKNILENFDTTKNNTLRANNLTLKSTVMSDRVYLRWTETYNDVEYSSFNLRFKNGEFSSFSDSRSYRKIGNTDVNISREQAISTALKQAEEYSYGYNGKVISNFTIVKDKIRTELKANVRETPSTYYPCWIVDLPLDDVYPGSVYFIRVMLWADNGKVISCRGMGYGGSIPNDDPNESSPTDSASTATSTPENVTPTQIENSTLPPSTIIIAVIVAAVLIPTLIAAIVLKKKKSK